MIPIVVGISCCALLLTVFFWFLRARRRELRDLETELYAWSKLPTDELGTICSLDFTDDLRERTERVVQLLGPKGFKIIERKTRHVVRIIQAAYREDPGCLRDEDLCYIVDKTGELRMELPQMRLELYANKVTQVTCLHAFRVACLYCQIAASISDAAVRSESDRLHVIAAKL